jgi:hypothetical protein
MSLEKRLDKIAATLAAQQPARQEIVRRIVDGVDDPKVVLDRMVADGEITEDQRGDVRFIRRVFIASVWETDAEGNSRLVGRRNVHTGEVEPVEGDVTARGL